jgi:hypothetical protein
MYPAAQHLVHYSDCGLYQPAPPHSRVVRDDVSAGRGVLSSESEDSGMRAARQDAHRRVDPGRKFRVGIAPCCEDWYMSVRPPYLPFPHRSHVAVKHGGHALRRSAARSKARRGTGRPA